VVVVYSSESGRLAKRAGTEAAFTELLCTEKLSRNPVLSLVRLKKQVRNRAPNSSDLSLQRTWGSPV